MKITDPKLLTILHKMKCGAQSLKLLILLVYGLKNCIGVSRAGLSRRFNGNSRYVGTPKV